MTWHLFGGNEASESDSEPEKEDIDKSTQYERCGEMEMYFFDFEFYRFYGCCQVNKSERFISKQYDAKRRKT